MGLSSSFASSLGLESADGGDLDDDQYPEATGDESETASAAIADMAAEDGEVAEAAAEGDDLEEKAEQTEEIAEQVEVAAEGAGLDPQASAILHLAFKNITGKAWAAKKLPKHESYSGLKSERIEATQLALEGIKETLKQFWEAIKAQFKKFFAKIKTWYIKTFDASKRMIARAKKLQERAESTSGTIENKTFSFSSAKSICVAGKVKDTAGVLLALSNLEKVADQELTVKSASEFDSEVDDVVSKFKNITDADTSTANAALTVVVGKYYQSRTSKGKNTGTLVPSTEADLIKQFGDAADIEVYRSDVLPGDRAFMRVVPKAVNKAGATNKDNIRIIRTARCTVSAFKAKGRDVEGTQDITTLTTSQISKMCDVVVTICESVFGFKKAWEARERHQEKCIKEIDSSVKNIADDKDVSSTISGDARSLAAAVTGSIRNDTATHASLVTLCLSSSGVYLTYGERSLAQYKSK